uniref:Monocarboxylate transporter n=1 Tax=Sipha flava TaxID=143950 RepID=A0A2S2Q1S5_9HEMI
MICPCEGYAAAIPKSRSWPMLFTVVEEETVGGDGTAHPTTVATVAGAVAAAQPSSDRSTVHNRLRCHQQQQQIAVPIANVGRLLRRHYYPEAGWGWVVVVCACLVHVLNHGLQLSFGTLEADVLLRFRDATYATTGQSFRSEDIAAAVVVVAVCSADVR